MFPEVVAEKSLATHYALDILWYTYWSQAVSLGAALMTSNQYFWYAPMRAGNTGERRRGAGMAGSARARCKRESLPIGRHSSQITAGLISRRFQHLFLR